jgi:hypothetical protein
MKILPSIGFPNNCFPRHCKTFYYRPERTSRGVGPTVTQRPKTCQSYHYENAALQAETMVKWSKNTSLDRVPTTQAQTICSYHSHGGQAMEFGSLLSSFTFRIYVVGHSNEEETSSTKHKCCSTLPFAYLATLTHIHVTIMTHCFPTGSIGQLDSF